MDCIVFYYSFIQRQLEYDPTNSNKKRVEKSPGYWTLSYRTWRIDFLLSERTASVIGIRSGYNNEELNDSDDKYKDKNLHKKYLLTQN